MSQSKGFEYAYTNRSGSNHANQSLMNNDEARAIWPIPYRQVHSHKIINCCKMSRDQTLQLSPFNGNHNNNNNSVVEGSSSTPQPPPNRPEDSSHSLRIMETQMNSIGASGGSQSQESLSNANICAGCGLLIWDRTMLSAMEQNWHNQCLKCHCCGGRLAEMGTSLFHRGNMLLCRQDYLK